MKKEVSKVVKRTIDKELVRGLVIGFFSSLVLFLLFYYVVGIRTSEDKILVGKEEVVFNLKNVQNTVDKDFPGGTVPIYNSEFCMKMYKEKYSKEVSQCEIRSVKTFSRINPLVIDIDCVCFD